MTTPAANGAIATILPPAGKYHVKVRYALTGTAETALNNVQIKANGAGVIGTLPSLTGSGWNEVEFYVTCNGTNQLIVAAIAGGTTGAIYSAQIVATKMT